MCKISELAESIIKSDKMSASEVIEFIGEQMETGATTSEAYHKLYEKVYGKIITREVADAWVRSMSIPDNTDRNTGMKWSLDTTTEVGNKININWHEIDKVEWYCVMNMMYADYWCVAKYAEKQDDAMFYAKLAKAWFYDDDIEDIESKTYKYYFDVVL